MLQRVQRLHLIVNEVVRFLAYICIWRKLHDTVNILLTKHKIEESILQNTLSLQYCELKIFNI